MPGEEKQLSSFEKGIKRRLGREKQLIEWIIGKYIIGVNSKWNSDNFPSTQLAKVVLNITGQSKRDFASIHRLVREILTEWEEKSFCQYVTTTKYAHCRKTKMVYYFHPDGLKKLKGILIDQHLNIFKTWEDGEWEHYMDNADVMRTRENIIKIISFELLNFTNKIDDSVSEYYVDNTEF
jgi:hypothetical protein